MDEKRTTEEELLTIAEASKYLKVFPGTLSRWVRTGMIPAHWLGGTYRLYRSELDAYLKEHATKPEIEEEVANV